MTVVGCVSWRVQQAWQKPCRVQETFELFSSDVHADLPLLHECSLGQPVKFRIRQVGSGLWT